MREMHPPLTSLTGGAMLSFQGFPHGMMTTHADVINQDILKFIKI